jgi:hypothetical protein
MSMNNDFGFEFDSSLVSGCANPLPNFDGEEGWRAAILEMDQEERAIRARSEELDRLIARRQAARETRRQEAADQNQ